MSMDKMIGFYSSSMANIADANWVQENVTILDNSAGVIPKTIRTIFVNGQCYPLASTKAYYAILLVTSQNGSIPNFAGNDSNLNTMLNSHRDLIWATQSGIVKFGEIPDDAIIPFEPKTGRKLEPGQKLVLCWLCRNKDNTTAGNLSTLIDWNIWFDY